MNRITQCLHGRGTVSGVMHHRNDPQEQVPSRYLAFTKRRRPVVFWNLTDRCNLACAHCYSRSGPGRDTKNELSTAEALALIDDFSAMGVPLILFSGGEPLLRDDIWELARHAHAKGDQDGAQHERHAHHRGYRTENQGERDRVCRDLP